MEKIPTSQALGIYSGFLTSFGMTSKCTFFRELFSRALLAAGLAHRRQQIAFLPAGTKIFYQAVQLARARGIFRQREGFAARLLQPFAVAQGMRHVERQIAALASAEKFSRAAQL